MAGIHALTRGQAAASAPREAAGRSLLAVHPSPALPLHVYSLKRPAGADPC